MRIKKYFAALLTLVIMFSYADCFAIYHKNDESFSTEQRGWEMEKDKNTVYFADGNAGLQILDISDLNNIKRLSKIETGFDTRVVEKYKNTIYVAGNGKLITYNVKDPKQPYAVKKDIVQNNASRGNVDDKRLGIFGGNSATIFDVSDAESPKQIASLSGWGNALSGCISKDYVYVINTKNVLYIYDISDLNDIQQLCAMQLDTAYTQDIAVIGDILYVADQKYFMTIDITDKTKPNVLFKADESAMKLQGIFVEHGRAYLAGYANEIAVYDVTNSKEPKEISRMRNLSAQIYAIRGDANNVYCAASGGFFSIDCNWQYDLSRMPSVPKESAVLGSDSNENQFYSSFTDITEHWAKDYITQMNGEGYVKGKSTEIFAPEDNITRGEYISIISRMATPSTERYKLRFSDVDADAWYSDYFETAYILGLIPGEMMENGKVQPEKNITREEMIAEAINLLEYKKGSIQKKENMPFTDSENISDWAKEAVLKAYSADIINGNDNNEFNPKNNASRAEACKILSIVYEMMTAEESEFIAQTKYNPEDNEICDFTKPYTEIEYEDDGRPIIIRVTDAVKPGELLSFYGEYMTNSEVYITEGTSYSEEPENEAKNIPIETQDKEGQNIVCKIPEIFKEGTYTAWVKNSVGYSKPITVNAARILWVDQEEAGKGSVIRINGRNLAAAEFGGTLKTSVALVNDTNQYTLELKAINPYQVQAVIGENIENGEYEIYVSNDGEVWNKCDETYGKITIKDSVYDPYHLNQPWADRFNWDRKIDITKEPYLADNSGNTDVTEIIQKAIDDVHTDGGGIIYFPEGVYKHTGFQMDSDVILMGDGMEKTKVIYAYKNDDVTSKQMIGTKKEGKLHGKIGFMNIGFFLDDSPNQGIPDAYFWLGEDWGENISNGQIKTAEYIFMKGCKIWAPMIRPEQGRGRGLGIVTVAKGHVLYENNILYGNSMSMMSNYISKYTHCINNSFTTSVGNLSIVGSHTVIEHNVISRNWWYETDYMNSQGIFMRGYSYVAENIIKNTGKPGGNDGEIVCTEVYRASTRMAGSVEEAGKNYIKVNPYKGADGKPLGYETSGWYLDASFGDGWDVVISAGKGLGQRRRVISLDEENETFNIEGEWDIIPDKTSKFVFVIAAYGATIYNNYANSCSKGFWLYGDCIDCVVTENNLIDGEGVFGYTCYILNENRARINVCYFNRMEENNTSGFSSKGKHCGIGIQAGVETENTEHILVYGVDIRNNSIYGGIAIPKSSHVESEAPPINGIYAVIPAWRVVIDNGFTVMKGITVENNKISKMDRGISVGNASEIKLENAGKTVKKSATQTIVLKNNVLESVNNELIDPLNEAIDIK